MPARPGTAPPPYAAGLSTVPNDGWTVSGHARCLDCGERTRQLTRRGAAVLFHRTGCPQGTGPEARPGRSHGGAGSGL
jgi:hypothetical protein